MSSSLNRIKKNMIEAMQSANNQGTSAYDSMAEVRRVEGDTAWVHIAGGVDETPVKLTIAAKAGDVVQVRVGGGRAWITGNASAPPTDDKTAIAAKGLANLAGSQANVAQRTADQAQTVANSALKSTKENAAQMAQMVINFNGDIENLQDQIDGNISTWFYGVDPAINLPPVTDWDTDEKKDAHLGDIYYNTVKGYAWRFMKSGSIYSWERITDTDVTKALADAAKAQDTADSKRRIFYNTPTVPYDAGDLWVQGSGGDILRCAQAKTSTGSYDRNDWVLASKYTDNSALNTWIEGDFATTIQELEEGLVDAKVETYYQATDPSTGWSDTQKSEHKGDLWYNSTASVQRYYRWSGTAWQELTATPPQAVFDSIDKKATIYIGTTTPTNPESGDLWFKGANEPILTYVNNSWVEYNKYTDDTAANTAKATADTAQSTAIAAKSAADSAARAAATAQSKADEASTAAATAQTKANEAASAAETAQSKAYSAGTAASKAQSSANAAGEAAAFAQAAAEAAQTAAATAQTTADKASAAASTAQSSADTAKKDAASAQTAAEAAQSTADNAQTAADSASSAASSAQSAASKAQKTADTAKENAAAAQSTADTAKTNAATAQTKANKAASAAETAQSDINSQREYFWHDANGAHVLGSKTAATRYRTDIDSEGMHIKDVSGEVQEVAKFTADGAQIGKGGNAESVFFVDNDGIDLKRKEYVYFHVGYSDNAIGKNGILSAPYYTVGNRREKEDIGAYSYAEGQNVISSGYTSHAEGVATKASEYCAHAEGDGSTASGESAHAEGDGTNASGFCAHAEGDNAVASGYGAHAEGSVTNASGFCAHAEGDNAVASGHGAHAEGKGTVANGDASHAQNLSTIARFEYQTVLGKYNANSEGNAVEVGNGGGKNSRSNAVTIDWNGNVTASGDIVPGKITGIANLIYPVGSIYMSVNGTSPATLFGGTWERIRDRFLLAAGSTYQAGSTGGEAEHKLTAEELPDHRHTFTTDSAGDHTHSLDRVLGNSGGNWAGDTAGNLSGSGRKFGYIGSKYGVKTVTDTGSGGAHTHTGTTNGAGGNKPHNNMPPYLTVYMWKRTA